MTTTLQDAINRVLDNAPPLTDERRASLETVFATTVNKEE